MKKQITAILAAAALAVSCVPAMAADNDMEKALVAVKSRVDIPQELSKFQSHTYTDDHETRYSFEWKDTDTDTLISISADAEGHVSFYHYYSPDIPVSGPYVYKPRNDYLAAAENFLSKAVPEMFTEDDLLVDTIRNTGVVNGAEFYFERRKDGIPVEGNTATVMVKYFNDNFYVTDCSINLDYKTGFENAEHPGMIEPQTYYNRFPLEVAYRKPMRYYRSANSTEEKAELVYRFKDYNAGYVSAYSGEVVEPDADNIIYDRSFATASGKGAAEEAAADLTPEERAEIDNVAGLKTTDEILQSIRAMNVFGQLPTADAFERETYKQDDKYIAALYYSDYENAKDKKDQPGSMYMTVNGMTGELMSLSSFYYGTDYDASYTDAEAQAGAKKIKDFLSKEFGEKLAMCGEPVEDPGAVFSLRYPRTVNGVKYDNNELWAVCDLKKGIIIDFSQTWDDDVSGFADPAKAIGEAAAKAKMEELAPVHGAYVRSGDKFTLCYTSDGANTEIDALTGEKVKPRDGYSEKKSYSYSDIAGHWAEDMIKAVAQYGAGLPGTEFKPDTEITQEELLRMLTSGMYYLADETDDLYRNAQDIIPEDEKAPNAAVLREDAFMYVARLMGFGRIATMDIFAPGFNDGADITPEKTGALAILRGYGIVKGDAGAARPKDKLTRAEAAALMYGYLTTEK